jgi:ABC-type branched-subunit amino acid transport system permease subunit
MVDSWGLIHCLAGPIIGALVITFILEYLRMAKEYMAKEYKPIITSLFIVLSLIDRKVKPGFAQMWGKIRGD